MNNIFEQPHRGSAPSKTETHEDFLRRLNLLKQVTLLKSVNMNFNFALAEAITDLFPDVFPNFEHVKENNTYTSETFGEKLNEFIERVGELKGGTNYRFSTALELVFPDVFKGSNF